MYYKLYKLVVIGKRYNSVVTFVARRCLHTHDTTSFRSSSSSPLHYVGHRQRSYRVYPFVPFCTKLPTILTRHTNTSTYLSLYIDQVSWLLQESVVDKCSNSDTMLQRLPLERGIKCIVRNTRYAYFAVRPHRTFLEHRQRRRRIYNNNKIHND